MTTIARVCALFFVGVLATGCADSGNDNASSMEAAQTANTASIKSGTYDYTYRGREGLVRKLVIRDDRLVHEYRYGSLWEYLHRSRHR